LARHWRDSEGRRRRQQVVGVRGDAGGRGLVLVLGIDDLFCINIWYGSNLRRHGNNLRCRGNNLRHGSSLRRGRNLFPGHNCPGTWSWCSRGVVALRPAVTTGVVPVVVAAETTTRAVATMRGTKWCPVVVVLAAEATTRAIAKARLFQGR
jgi:hypothetical protein